MPRNDDIENKKYAEDNKEPEVMLQMVTAEQLTIAKLDTIDAKLEWLIGQMQPKETKDTD